MLRILLLGIALAVPAIAVAQTKQIAYTQDQVAKMVGAIKNDCHTLAVGEGGGDALYQKCIDYQKAEWKTWTAFSIDPSVSQLVWDQCSVAVHFNVTHDVHGYNVCIRLAKDRPDLKDNIQQ